MAGKWENIIERAFINVMKALVGNSMSDRFYPMIFFRYTWRQVFWLRKKMGRREIGRVHPEWEMKR